MRCKCNYMVLLFSENCKLDMNKLKLLQKYENTDCEFTVIKSFGDQYLISCPFLETILQ